MNRREFITLLGGVAAVWSRPLRAQVSPTVARFGFLGSSSPSAWASRLEALRAGLRDYGYIDGRNFVFEFRWAGGNNARLPELAAELVRLKVDILVTHGTPGTFAAKRATTTIPIVMVHSGDAVGTGLIASLARPGGNITGSSLFNPELNAKRIELLKQLLPGITGLAVFIVPNSPLTRPNYEAMQSTAKSLNVALHQFEIRKPDEFEGAFSAMVQRRIEAVVVPEAPRFIASAKEIAKLAASAKLASAGFGGFAAAGGLIGYGANYLAVYRRAAVFVDKILRGVKPADIPVEQPTKFNLVVNFKTAKALGLTVPPTLLARADEVIE